MASPIVESANIAGSGTNVSSVVSNITTLSSNTVIVLGIAMKNASGFSTVSSVAATGLTFTRADINGNNGYATVLAAQSGINANADMRMEIWSAPVAAAGTYSTTITLNQSTLGVNVRAIVVKSVFDTLSWWDGNASLPAHASNPGGMSSAGITINYSTSQADDLLLLFVADNAGGTFNAITNWTSLLGQNVGGGIGMDVYDKTNSALETGASVTFTTNAMFSVFAGIVGMLIGLTADDKGGLVLQTFVSCVCT